MDERELIGLLYRADWTRLALTGTVRGVGQFPPPSRVPWGRPDWLSATSESAADESTLLLAPGKRYRLERTDRSRVLGCDGERVWQWFAQVPPGASAGFEPKPRCPLPGLLAPAWLLTGYRLEIEGETTALGRPVIAVSGTVRTGHQRTPLSAESLLSGLLPPARRIAALIDAELGIVLRRELRSAPDDEDAAVTEFLSVAVGDAGDGGDAEPSAFAPLDGSFFGDAVTGEQNPLEKAGREAAKLVGGLAAGGLGAAIKYAPKRQADPFAAATAEDPDDAMPQDEQPPSADGDGTPVGDELLGLLYRGGLEPAPFSGTYHEWADGDVIGGALLAAVPESARQAGFGGFGFLLDAMMELGNQSTSGRDHEVFEVRVGGWQKYRIDRAGGPASTAASGPRRRRGDREVLTVACDGERLFRVFADEVRVGPATTLDGWRFANLVQLLDGSWLLGCALAGGDPVDLDGRAAYRVVATEGALAVRAPLSWLPTWWLPAVALVDASSGRLLRLTRFRDGRPSTRLELRSVTDGGSDDFGFTPPDGLPVVDEPERGRWFGADADAGSGSDDEDEDEERGGDRGRPRFYGPDGRPTTPPEVLQAAVDGLRDRVDETVAAARGFLDSFFGGRR